VYFGFDDWEAIGSDQDYNDVVIHASSNCTLNTTKIPCYTTCRYSAQVKCRPFSFAAPLGNEFFLNRLLLGNLM
jgi:hypothetical protein